MQRASIIQGELHVASEPDVLISTLLGSCIAVCLHDATARVGGMNHFLLGEPASHQRVSVDDMTQYGVHAMELLINEMMKRGAQRAHLRAHVYGGANIIAGLGQIGSSNAAFATKFIATEGIALGRTELGGNQARRVEFLPYLGKVRSWPIDRRESNEIEDTVLRRTSARTSGAAPSNSAAIAEGDLELF